MNKIGIIGGIGPASTAIYYRQIISQYQEKLKTENYPEFLIHSINMTEMLSYAFDLKLNKLTGFLAEKVRVLEKAGCDYGVLASNTPHIVFDDLQETVNLPLISIVTETCKAAQKVNLKRVALFGTKSTMTAGFYAEKANEYGFEIILPDSDEQDFIHFKYMSELVQNMILPETKAALFGIIDRLYETHTVDGLILGGTELSLILEQSDYPFVRFLDTTKIHVKAIVDKMTE